MTSEIEAAAEDIAARLRARIAARAEGADAPVTAAQMRQIIADVADGIMAEAAAHRAAVEAPISVERGPEPGQVAVSISAPAGSALARALAASKAGKAG